jgi:hypothetical protein
LTTVPDGATIKESPNHIVPVQAERSRVPDLKMAAQGCRSAGINKRNFDLRNVYQNL